MRKSKNAFLRWLLSNINLLLLLLLLFLVFRNLVKLLYDRKRKVMGARLRTRLVVAFVSLTLLPTIVLFFFSINFIANSIEFWFNVPVEQALENSLNVGRHLYKRAEDNNRFYAERIAYQLTRQNLLAPDKIKDLKHYLKVVENAFNIDTVEVYTTSMNRVAGAFDSGFKQDSVKAVPADDFQKERGPSGVLTLSERLDRGELIRTIATVPVNATEEEAQAYVVLGKMTPIAMADGLSAISRGFEEYQQIKLLKKPIQITYYIALSIVALLVVFCAIWFGFYLAKSITIPIMELVDGTRRVAEGDLSFTITTVADDEIGSLVESFNKMTHDLRIYREQIEQTARLLREQNTEIEEKRQYMEIVLENVSAGVISTDASGTVTTINKSAERMLLIRSARVIGRDYPNLLSKPLLKLADETLDHIAASAKDAVEFPLRLAVGGTPKSFMMHVSALKDDAGANMGVVLVFDDMTELEKAQRMAAWREVARRIAHEVKNPLTPIKLSAQRLKRKYSDQLDEPVFDECTDTIIDHVDLIRNLVNEFAAFARFPTADPKPCNLPPIIDETVALYREGHPGVRFILQNKRRIPKLNLDRQQIKQAMINLVDNAIAAIRQNGDIEIGMDHDSKKNRVYLWVADNGEGITDEDKTRLFEPYFSTKKAGMGLGLTIVSTIINDHQGALYVTDNEPKGAKFIIELPV